ncbi:hypothetical protein E3P99_02663 [Wallemia hederae]|uniref:Vps52 coiled-coil domain-containing protein n=1 Tax=Wallemia hederae TaxID=1540922 RepID=A0A4T0FIT2_9BASI|nr:hypothetical protein E3P99_02663 [Wallemia hederae]
MEVAVQLERSPLMDGDARELERDDSPSSPPIPNLSEQELYQGTEEGWNGVIELLREDGRDIELVSDSLRRSVDEEPKSAVLSTAAEALELDDSIERSIEDTDSVATFLSTFQQSLLSTSSQISSLQTKSTEIDEQLQKHRAQADAIDALLKELVIPPQLIQLVMHKELTDVDAWVSACNSIEAFLRSVEKHQHVKARVQLQGVLQALKMKAADKIRSKLFSLFAPFQASATSNIAFHQTAVLFKYAPLYAFLKRQEPQVAQEVERVYANSARGYYETCMVRYTREAFKIAPRFQELSIANAANAWESNEEPHEHDSVNQRLTYSTLDGPSVFLAYQADDQNFKLPPEALFRSLLLTFIDNACSEFAFCARFFDDSLHSLYRDSKSKPGVFLSEKEVAIASELGSLKSTQQIWTQVFETASNQIKSDLLKIPTATTLPSALFSMIRINDEAHEVCLTRGCLPASTLCASLRIALWPLLQKEMDGRVTALQKLADETQAPSASLLGTAGNFVSSSMGFGVNRISTELAEKVSKRYATLYRSLKELSTSDDQMMMQSNIRRLRTLVQSVLEKAASRSEKADWLPSAYSALALKTRSFDDERSYWLGMASKHK